MVASKANWRRILKLLGWLVVLPVALMIVIAAIRISNFTVSYSNGYPVEFPVLAVIPAPAIALSMRYALSPNKRSVAVTVLIFVVLLVSGGIQEYLIARHIALAMGIDPASAPLLPTLPQFLTVITSNVRSISYVLIGVFVGTLLVALMKDFSSSSRR